MKWSITYQGNNFDEKGQRLILPDALGHVIDEAKIALPYYDITYILPDNGIEYFFECRTDSAGDLDHERKKSSDLLNEKRIELEALGCQILHSTAG